MRKNMSNEFVNNEAITYCEDCYFIRVSGTLIYSRSHNPASTRRSSNVGTMLSHRLRRWPSIVPTLNERVVGVTGHLKSKQLLFLWLHDRLLFSRCTILQPISLIFNFVNFKNVINMKLYSLLILTKNTKKYKYNFKAPKRVK